MNMDLREPTVHGAAASETTLTTHALDIAQPEPHSEEFFG
jgi:hypothetical protein